MLVCPDCRHPKPIHRKMACKACGWQGRIVDGISVLLPQSHKSSLREAYARAYDDLAREDLSASIADESYVRALAKGTANLFGNVAGKKACDIGSGKGFLADHLLEAGAEVTAVDLALPYLEAMRAHKRLRRVQANAEFLPFENEFDIAVSTDVLEHVMNPGNFLFSLNRALRYGGKALVRVPLEENLLTYATQLKCKYELVHLRSFTSELLRQTLEGVGLRVESIELGGYSLSMHLPDAVKDEPDRAAEVEALRAELQGKGVTPEELVDWPSSITAQLSRPYFITAVATKTANIEADENNIFILNR